MMNLSRRDFVKTAAVFGGLALTGCGGSKGGSDAPAPAADFALVKEGTLIVASDLDFEPLGFLKNGKPAGFDVDLSNEIAKRLGLTCEYLEPQVFDDIIPLIKKGGTADIGVSAFSITDDRKKEIDFTDSYLDSGLAIAVKKTLGIVGTEETIVNELSAPDMVIAVRPGTTGEAWVREHIPNATVEAVEAVTDCMAGVSSGAYQAFCADLPVVAGQCASAFTDCTVCLEIPTGEQYGIVVSKDNPGLTAAINTVLENMKADGTIDSFKSTWLSA